MSRRMIMMYTGGTVAELRKLLRHQRKHIEIVTSMPTWDATFGFGDGVGMLFMRATPREK